MYFTLKKKDLFYVFYIFIIINMIFYTFILENVNGCQKAFVRNHFRKKFYGNNKKVIISILTFFFFFSESSFKTFTK